MLKNLSVRFDPVEDRLLMRLEFEAEEGGAREHWLHLTRRVCAAWRGDLQKMSDLSAELPARLDPVAKAVVAQAHHQVMASQATTRTEPAPKLQPPGVPALVTGIGCGRRKDDGRWVIRFDLRDQPALTLVLSTQTLHALVDALSRRVAVADWALPLLPVDRPVGPSPSSAPLH